MKDKMRTFIAVDLPMQVKRGLSDYIRDLSRGRREYRWVALNNLHITMAFLGDVGFDDIPGIASAMQRVTSTVDPFPAGLGPVGTFPSVIWVGLSEGDEGCRDIYDELKSQLHFTGILLDDKRYHPHITIARTRRRMEPETRKWFEDSPPPQSHSFKVSEIILFESRLSPHGPEYIPLQKVPLGG